MVVCIRNIPYILLRINKTADLFNKLHTTFTGRRYLITRDKRVNSEKNSEKVILIFIIHLLLDDNCILNMEVVENFHKNLIMTAFTYVTTSLMKY